MVWKSSLTESGHSMLELLVCIGMAMLVCTAALPKMCNMDKLYVKYETLRLMNTIRYIQTCAHQWDYSDDIDAGRPYLHFYTRGNYYCIRSRSYGWDYHIGEHGVKIVSNRRDVRFTARGQAYACTVRIRKGSYEERIIIDTVGRARVETG